MLNQLNYDLKQAILNKDDAKKRALRGLLTAITIERTSKNNTELSNEDILKVIQKQIKTRKQSVEEYNKANRIDLVQVEKEEIEVLETYLPQQLSIEEVENIVKDIITNQGATSIKDMGKIMGIASKELAGKADNKTISEIVKSLLN